MPSGNVKKRKLVNHETPQTPQDARSNAKEIHADEDNVWPVEAIVGEAKGNYLIRWKGADANGKPWDDSWVSKRDVTDDLVEEWRRSKPVKQVKRKGKDKLKGKADSSLPPSQDRPESRAESSKSAAKRSSRSSKSLAPESTSTRQSVKPEPLEGTSKKRKRNEALSTTESDILSKKDDEPGSPHKKRRQERSSSSTLSPPPPLLPPRVNGVHDDTEGFYDNPNIYDEIPAPPPAPKKPSLPRIRLKKVSKRRLDDDEDQDVPVPSTALQKSGKSSKTHASKQKTSVKVAGKTGEREKERRMGDKRLPSEPKTKAGPSVTESIGEHASGSKVKANAEPDREKRRSVSPSRRSPLEERRSVRPGTLSDDGGNDEDADGETDVGNADIDMENAFIDDLLGNGIDDAEPSHVSAVSAPAKSPPHRPLSPPRTKDPEDVDTSVGTVIPETQSSKENSSLDESSQLQGVNDTSSRRDDAQPDMPEVQTVPPRPNRATSSGKVLKPIPIVTPSKFRPHLKTYSSVTGQAMALRKQVSSAAQKTHDAPPSSIESHFSPEKNGRPPAANLHADGDGAVSTVVNDQEDEIEDLEPSLHLKTRGLELGEMDRVQRRAKLPAEPKRSLPSILNHREVRSLVGSSHSQQDEDALVQQMEQQYVNLDGSVGQPDEVAGKAVENSAETAERSQPDSHQADIIEETRLVSPATQSSPNDDPQPKEARTPPQSHILQKKRQIINSPTRQLDSALGLLNQKSEEIHGLKNRLTDADELQQSQKIRIAQLEAENAALVHEQGKFAQVDPTILAQLEITRKERDDIAKERDTALAELDLTKIAKQAALDDDTFLREQYGIASARAMELVEENSELQTRIQVAESQVTHGLQIVRNDYESRLAALKTELEKSQILTKILVERDRRTDDEIRKIAATVPQLEANIERLKKVNAERKDEIDALVKHREALLVAQIDLRDEVKRYQEENARARTHTLQLSAEVARYGARERSILKELGDSPPVHMDDDVYLCEWLDGETRCGLLFSSVQDLQDHLFISSHL